MNLVTWYLSKFIKQIKFLLIKFYIFKVSCFNRNGNALAVAHLRHTLSLMSNQINECKILITSTRPKSLWDPQIAYSKRKSENKMHKPPSTRSPSLSATWIFCILVTKSTALVIFSSLNKILKVFTFKISMSFYRISEKISEDFPDIRCVDVEHMYAVE